MSSPIRKLKLREVMCQKESDWRTNQVNFIPKPTLLPVVLYCPGLLTLVGNDFVTKVHRGEVEIIFRHPYCGWYLKG